MACFGWRGEGGWIRATSTNIKGLEMWVALKVLGWIGVALVAWTLLAVAALCVMYGRGWLNPKRSEKIREWEDAAGAAAEAKGRVTGEKPASTTLRG